MAQHGIKYVYDNILFLGSGSFALWYQFDGAELTIPNSGNYPQCSGALSSLGNFYSNPGSGTLTGQRIVVQNVQNLNSNNWSHLFIQEKPNQAGGVLFDSFISGGGVYSGYLLGITDSNRLYYEAYDNNGPFVIVSKLTYGVKNCSAVVRNDNLITFYTMDFGNDVLLSDQYPIQGQFMPPANKAVLFNTGIGCPRYVSGKAYSGYIDEYVYIKDALTPANLKQLISGFVNDYVITGASITVVSSTGISGYQMGLTGVTGVLGTNIVINGSGVDSCGNSYLNYTVQNITGYITSGSGLVPIYIVNSITVTGDGFISGVLNSGFKESFKLNDISYTRKIEGGDVSTTILFNQNIQGINQEAVYDLVDNGFKLNAIYEDTTIEPYLNGQALLNNGFSITGNFYGSGYVLSGDYILQGQLLNSTGFHDTSDRLIYDLLTGNKSFVFNVTPTSGFTESLLITDKSLVFLNGVLLNSGADYLQIGNNFVWNTNFYQGISGKLFNFEVNQSYRKGSGIFPSTESFPRTTSMLWLNGQRMILNNSYLENSTSDLIGRSGLYINNLDNIYTNEENFWNI